MDVFEQRLTKIKESMRVSRVFRLPDGTINIVHWDEGDTLGVVSEVGMTDEDAIDRLLEITKIP